MLWQLKTWIGRGQLGQGYRATTCIAYLHSLQNVHPCHAKPAHRLCLYCRCAAPSQRNSNAQGDWETEERLWSLDRSRCTATCSSAASAFLPPTFSLRLYCTTSPVQQQHPPRGQISQPRQDLINPPSFVIDRSPSHTYQAQQNVATLLGFVCRTTFVCVFYHVPKQILLELFVNDS
jgi:hypothetical protein